MRKLAHIERITSLTPIPGADIIELAEVLGWKVIVKKGTFYVGQQAVLFEIDSLIPRRSWSSFLFKDTRELYRLKSIKMRGVLSQGLLVPYREIPEMALSIMEDGEDVTAMLGIQKWEPTLPANLIGKVKGSFPSWLKRTDESRIQGYPELLNEIREIPYYISQKMDGTSLTCYKHEGVFGVCSRNLELKDGGDDYWAMAKALDLPNKLPDGYALQGELAGPGIQKNPMGLKEKALFIFNVWDIGAQRYLDFGAFTDFTHRLGLDTVPILATNKMDNTPQTMDEWLEWVSALDYPNGSPAEGIVIRPTVETYSQTLKGRLSFKIISNRYLLSKGE